MTDPAGIAIAIPAHDEEATIDRTLVSVFRAAPATLPVVVVVAADACCDRTVQVVRRRAADAPRDVELHVVELQARNVGVARQAACVAASARLAARVGRDASWWIATTDADSEVPPDWLTVHQRWASGGADAVVGLVRVDPHARLMSPVRHRVDREFAAAGFDHRHVYGANLGVTSAWWDRVGGFPSVPVGEDERFVRSLRHAGARVVAVDDSVVVTSGRLVARAPLGFGARLARLTAHA